MNEDLHLLMAQSDIHGRMARLVSNLKKLGAAIGFADPAEITYVEQRSFLNDYSRNSERRNRVQPPNQKMVSLPEECLCLA